MPGQLFSNFFLSYRVGITIESRPKRESIYRYTKCTELLVALVVSHLHMELQFESTRDSNCYERTRQGASELAA
jgi:hypothetical protein